MAAPCANRADGEHFRIVPQSQHRLGHAGRAVGLGGVDIDRHRDGIARGHHQVRGQAQGRVGARWLPEPLSQPTSDGGRFLRLGRGLFLVTDEEVVEVSVEDITDKKNGWK